MKKFFTILAAIAFITNMATPKAHAQMFGYGGWMRGYDFMMGVGANVNHDMTNINHFGRDIQEGVMAGQIFDNAHMIKMQRDQMRESNIAMTRCQVFNRMHHINQPCVPMPAYNTAAGMP